MLLGQFDLEEFQVESSKVQTDSALIAFFQVYGVWFNCLHKSIDCNKGRFIQFCPRKSTAWSYFFTIEYFRKGRYYPKCLPQGKVEIMLIRKKRNRNYIWKKLKSEIQKNVEEMADMIENNITQLKTGINRGIQGNTSEMKKEIQENLELPSNKQNPD